MFYESLLLSHWKTQAFSLNLYQGIIEKRHFALKLFKKDSHRGIVYFVIKQMRVND